jgi:hypothetical protein
MQYTRVYPPAHKYYPHRQGDNTLNGLATLFALQNIGSLAPPMPKTIMPALLLAYFLLTYLGTLVLGYLQTPAGLPSTQAETTNSECYSTLAVAAVCIQAFVSVTTLGGTDVFPLAALFVAFTLLCHHAIIHRRSRFEGEVCSCAPFQCKDICNHETWIVASIVAAAISQLHI